LSSLPVGFPCVCLALVPVFQLSQFLTILPAVLYLSDSVLDYWPLPALDLSLACPRLCNKLLLLWNGLGLLLSRDRKMYKLKQKQENWTTFTGVVGL
jgi:hypothetical protein